MSSKSVTFWVKLLVSPGLYWLLLKLSDDSVCVLVASCSLQSLLLCMNARSSHSFEWLVIMTKGGIGVYFELLPHEPPAALSAPRCSDAGGENSDQHKARTAVCATLN